MQVLYGRLDSSMRVSSLPPLCDPSPASLPFLSQHILPYPNLTPRQDLAAIKAGAYKLPWDMTSPTHRQFNPLYMARK